MTASDQETITDHRDRIETCILLAMHCTRKGTRVKEQKDARKNTVRIGMEFFCPRKPEFPNHFFAFDAADDSRLYSDDMDSLVVDPITAIGNGLEIGMMLEDGSLKWSKITPMVAPKGLVAITNQRHRWFCWHFRHYRTDGLEEYVRRPMALTLDGSVCRLKPLGSWRGFNADKDVAEIAIQLAMSLSIFEDANRANAFLATVEEHVKMTFPIGQDHYKKFLIMRDGYKSTPTGRKNPILHWVADHFRQKTETVIETHLRGAEEFVVGPMRLSIAPTAGYGRFSPSSPEPNT